MRGDQTILLRPSKRPTTLGGMYPRHPDPTPEEIQQACEELQRDWTDAEFYRRSHFSLGNRGPMTRSFEADPPFTVPHVNVSELDA